MLVTNSTTVAAWTTGRLDDCLVAVALRSVLRWGRPVRSHPTTQASHPSHAMPSARIIIATHPVAWITGYHGMSPAEVEAIHHVALGSVKDCEWVGGLTAGVFTLRRCELRSSKNRPAFRASHARRRTSPLPSPPSPSEAKCSECSAVRCILIVHGADGADQPARPAAETLLSNRDMDRTHTHIVESCGFQEAVPACPVRIPVTPPRMCHHEARCAAALMAPARNSSPRRHQRSSRLYNQRATVT